MKVKKNRDSGFSLVELIVVIVILAILIGVTIVGVFKYVNQARRNTDIQNCETLQSAIWANGGTYKFPKLGYPYSYTAVMSYDDNNENIYGLSFVFGETVGQWTYELDGNKGIFQGVINKCFEDRTNNKTGFAHIPCEMKAGGNMFVVIAVDENGQMINCVVGILDKFYRSRVEPYRLGMLHNPLIETTSTHEIVLTQTLYDGVYKFYE